MAWQCRVCTYINEGEGGQPLTVCEMCAHARVKPAKVEGCIDLVDSDGDEPTPAPTPSLAPADDGLCVLEGGFKEAGAGGGKMSV